VCVVSAAVCFDGAVSSQYNEVDCVLFFFFLLWVGGIIITIGNHFSLFSPEK
jgi:hypothetical protein